MATQNRPREIAHDQPVLNQEAQKQGNPPSSGYNPENRAGAEQMRQESEKHPGSEYNKEKSNRKE